jgi:catalase (peroxidase I)
MLQTDLMLKFDATFLGLVQMYAADNELFLSDFAAAWSDPLTL